MKRLFTLICSQPNFILLLLALWNTVVAAINAFILPLFLPAEALIFITPKSQLLPVFIPLALWVIMSRTELARARLMDECFKSFTQQKGNQR